MTNCIFICSAGHSGSTLLDLLIGSNSQVASLGEISHLPKNIALNTQCTCGVPVRSCNCWQQVIEKINRQLDTDIMVDPYSLNLGPFKAMVVVDRSRQTRLSLTWNLLVKAFWYIELRYGLQLMPIATKNAKRGIENNFSLYDAVGETLNVKAVVDSSKSYFKAAELYRQCPSRVKIILLIRDGRAVFYSGIKNGYRRRHCLNAWKNFYSRALPILETKVEATNILRIHYENFAKNPEEELKRVCEFSGLEFEPDMLDFLEHEHHITNGNNMRFGSHSTIRFDDSWRNNLCPEDLRYFERRARLLNRLLGYS